MAPEIDDATEQWTLNESDRLAVVAGCWFSVAHGERVCKFIETFCHLSQGRWAGRPLKLMEWQREFLMRLFGWRRADGKRRFRRAFLLAAKKNGKSPMLSAVELYLLLADGEAAPEIYICACDRDQAGIIFTESARMIEYSPSLQRRVEVTPSRKVITSGHGRIVANSSDSPKLDGLNASAVLWDEIHRQPDRQLYDVMEYAVVAREQPITLVISTAGEQESGVWFELLEYSQKVETGVIQDMTHLGVIYKAEESDDIDDPATWRKANPSLGITFSEDDFRHDLEEAKGNPAKMRNFLRLRLNIVTGGDDAFLDIADWDACGGAWELHGTDAPCFAGLDLSSNDDLCAFVVIQGDLDIGFDVGVMFWLPEDNIVELERRHGQPYREWAKEGWITLTTGNRIDDSFIEAGVVEIAQRCQIKGLFIDPWNARRIGPAFAEKHGIPVMQLRQGWASLNSPTKMLWDLVGARKIRHQNNPILRWHALNAVIKLDAGGNWKIDKSKRTRKIDGLAALIDAIAAAMETPPEEPSVYETPGNLLL
jgi:phage terminase large subunit-like protein